MFWVVSVIVVLVLIVVCEALIDRYVQSNAARDFKSGDSLYSAIPESITISYPTISRSITFSTNVTINDQGLTIEHVNYTFEHNVMLQNIELTMSIPDVDYTHYVTDFCDENVDWKSNGF